MFKSMDCVTFHVFPECSNEDWLLMCCCCCCCRWRKPKREQLATRHYIDEYNASQTATDDDDDIVVYHGVDDSSFSKHSENGILQRISIQSNKGVDTKADEISLLCCDPVNDVDETTVKCETLTWNVTWNTTYTCVIADMLTLFCVFQ